MLKIHPQGYGSQSRYYEVIYQHILGNKAKKLLGLLSRYPHRLMERDFRSNEGLDTLELGVGSGEHIPFVAQDFSSYLAIDKSKETFQEIHSRYPRVECMEGNAETLNLEDKGFDRVIVTCLLAHLDEPEKSLRKWFDLVRDGGFISVYLPAEPSLALRFFRYLIPRRAASRLGFQGYDLFIAREHKSSIYRLLTIIKESFEEDAIRVVRRPFPFFGWYFNLFYIVHISVSRS